MPPVVEYIHVNGAKLAYRLAGSRSDRLIITLHGGRGFGRYKNLNHTIFNPNLAG